jgi:hypothetical protein
MITLEKYKEENGIHSKEIIPKKTGKKHFILPLFFIGKDGTLHVHNMMEY